MGLDRLAVVHRRMHEQRLAEEPFDTPAQVVGWLGGVQAQEHATNRYWYKQSGLGDALLARSHEVFREALEAGDPLLRKELAEALTLAGVEQATGIRLSYLTMHASWRA